MKTRVLLFAFTLLGFISMNAQNDTILKAFRTLQLHKRTISLNDDISKYADIAIKADPTHYYLKKGSFGVADSIGLEVNQAKKIIAFRFFYNYEPEFSNDTAYIHELHKYQKLLNSPGREYQYASAKQTIRATKWEEKEIMYELMELNANGKKRAYSVIFDKAPYFKSMKCGDVKNKDNSIELLNLIGVN